MDRRGNFSARSPLNVRETRRFLDRPFGRAPPAPTRRFATLTNPRPSGFLPGSVEDTQRKSPAWPSPFRRRRRNRPGNAQANGPLGDDALESGLGASRLGPPTGVTAAKREISQVTGQRGRRRGAVACVANGFWRLALSNRR
jgi:hypothetical protein